MINLTPEQAHLKAAELKHSHWVVDICNGCDYSIGYRFNGDNVTYDPGCRCEGAVMAPTVNSSWITVAAEINSLLKTDKREEVIKYWKL